MLVRHTLYRACGPPYDCTLRFKCMAWYVPSWMVCWPHVPAGRSSGSPTSQLINHQVASHLVVHSSHAMSNYFIADEGCNMIFLGLKKIMILSFLCQYLLKQQLLNTKRRNLCTCTSAHQTKCIHPIQFNQKAESKQCLLFVIIPSTLSLSLWNEIWIFM